MPEFTLQNILPMSAEFLALTISTLFNLAGLLTWFIAERRNRRALVHSAYGEGLRQLTARVEGFPCAAQAQTVQENRVLITRIETVQKLLQSHLDAYHAFLHDGGIMAVMSNYETLKERVRLLENVVDTYGVWLERYGLVRGCGGVVLVEDNEDDEAYLRASAKQSGYCGDFTVFRTGSSALEFFSSFSGQKPDFIILDLRLPDMSGIEILSFLKRDSYLLDVPVIIVTGLEPDAYGDSLTSADFVQQKPIKFGTLLQAFRKFSNELRMKSEGNI